MGQEITIAILGLCLSLILVKQTVKLFLTTFVVEKAPQLIRSIISFFFSLCSSSSLEKSKIFPIP